MKHQTLEQLQVVAEVDQGYSRQAMSRGERLERWAQLLERNPDRRLSTLYQTEYQPGRARGAMRAHSNSRARALRRADSCFSSLARRAPFCSSHEE